jgi:signal peptidase
MIKNAKKVLSNLFFATTLVVLVLVVVFCVLLGRADDFYVFGYKPFIIATGSMETNYMTNSTVVIKKGGYDDVQVGNVIAFRAKAMGDKMAFHRVVQVTGGGFVTKGDNNSAVDGALVARDNYIGREAFHTNATAYFVQELHKPGGFFRVVVLPLLAILLIITSIYIIRRWNTDILHKLLAVSAFTLVAGCLVLTAYMLWNNKRVDYINSTLAGYAQRFDSSGVATTIKVDNNKVIGTVKIDTLGMEYPIINYTSQDSLGHAITYYVGSGLNRNGNAVLAGNKAHGDLFFTNINRLRKGDTVIVTDIQRRQVAYRVVDSFVTTPNDKTVLKQDKAKRELTLVSCEKNLSDRYVVKLEAEPLKN